MPSGAASRACLTLKSRQLEALKGLSRETGALVAEPPRRAVDSYPVAHLHGHELESDRPGTGRDESVANSGPLSSICLPTPAAPGPRHGPQPLDEELGRSVEGTGAAVGVL